MPIPDKNTQRLGMRRFLFILILMTCMPISIQALRLGTSSEYRNGSFYTSVVCLVDAPYAKVSATLDEVDAGMKESPTKSIPWAWRNLGQRRNPDGNDLRLSENGVSYDEKTSAYKLNMLVGVQGDEDPMSFVVEGFLHDYHTRYGNTLHLQITKKIKILSNADFRVAASPYGANRTLLQLNTQICFGWFFSMFFTQKRYKSVMEWRLQGFVANLKQHAENLK